MKDQKKNRPNNGQKKAKKKEYTLKDCIYVKYKINLQLWYRSGDAYNRGGTGLWGSERKELERDRVTLK